MIKAKDWQIKACKCKPSRDNNLMQQPLAAEPSFRVNKFGWVESVDELISQIRIPSCF